MKNKIFFFLMLIVVLTGFFRFWQLANYPVSLSIDEVAVGYNSYSILKTGRDEFGEFLPLAFRSVGDYKTPVLIYLMTPSIAIFGLNEFGVRFTIALIGVLTIPVVFFLLRQLTRNSLLSLFTAFSLAISPWHTFFSRMSFDGILGLFFLLLSVWLFLRATAKNGQFLWLAGIFFVLSMYSYHAERVFAPMLFLILIVIYGKELRRTKKACLVTLLIVIILSLPLAKMMMGIEGQKRARMTFLAQDENISYVLHQPGAKLSPLQSVLDSNPVMLGNFWAKRYLNYWDPSFLFFKGMKFSLPGAPDSGIFYFFELPLFFVGLWLLLFRQPFVDKRVKILLVLWFLLGPLPASLTNNEQHTSRSLIWIPILPLLVGMGGLFLWNLLAKLKPAIRKLIYAGTVILILTNIIYVADLYFVHYSIQFSEHWDYGLKEASIFAWEHEKEYKEIVVDNVFGTLGPYSVGTPHLYLLFYGKYDPATLQKERGSNSDDFGKFKFRTIYWPDDRKSKNTLFIGSPWRLPLKDLEESQILKKIYFKNNQLGFLVVKT